jgi:hypothetical protein
MAAIPFDGPAERVFEHIADLSNGSKWTLESDIASDPSGFQVESLDFRGERFLRTTFDMDVPFADSILACRPDLMFHPSRSNFDPDIIECGIDELIAPGNATAWARIRPLSDASRLSALVAALSGRCSDLQHLTQGSAEPDGGIMCRSRVITKRDFPCQGQFCTAIVPMHPETRELMEEFDSRSWVIVLFRAHPLGASKTIVMTLKKQPNMPDWAKPIAETRIDKLVQSMFEEQIRKQLMCFQSPMWRKARDDSQYVIISLRKCSHGGPLLPCTSLPVADSVWEQTDTHGRSRMSLADYLREFLKRLNICGVTVHDSMDGQYLVPYQAAVRRGEWDRTWQILEDPYKAQRAAYRWLFGGSSAPELKLVQEPKFQTPGLAGLSDSDTVSDGASTSGESAGRSSDRSQDVPVRTTFVHFSAGPTLRRRRCGSMPPRRMEDCVVHAH